MGEVGCQLAEQKERHVSDCAARQERDSQGRADRGAYDEEGLVVKMQTGIKAVGKGTLIKVEPTDQWPVPSCEFKICLLSLISLMNEHKRISALRRKGQAHAAETPNIRSGN